MELQYKVLLAASSKHLEKLLNTEYAGSYHVYRIFQNGPMFTVVFELDSI